MENPLFEGVRPATLFFNFFVSLKEHFPVMLGKCKFFCTNVKNVKKIEILVFRN
jgi:hypothetical protein